MGGSRLTPGDILHCRAIGVRRARPEWSYAEAVAYCLQVDPALKRAYAATPTPVPPADATVVVSEESAAARRKAAGDEVLRRARSWLAARAGQGGTLDEAVRVVVAADAQLARRYLGWE